MAAVLLEKQSVTAEERLRGFKPAQRSEAEICQAGGWDLQRQVFQGQPPTNGSKGGV